MKTNCIITEEIQHLAFFKDVSKELAYGGFTWNQTFTLKTDFPFFGHQYFYDSIPILSLKVELFKVSP